MPANAPMLAVCFNVRKLRARPGSAADHGGDSWEVFWRAVDPVAVAGGHLFAGDVPGRDVFCVAIQHADQAILDGVRVRLEGDAGFRGVRSNPPFLAGGAAASLPLTRVGLVERSGAVGGGEAAEAANAARGRARGPVPAGVARWWQFWKLV